MTLVLTINGPNTIWMLTDTRLSAEHRKPDDDGQKMVLFDGTDGRAMIGYAGLGRTTSGMEPSEWISNTLRGRLLSVEAALSVLAQELKVQLPNKLGPITKHIVIATSIVDKEVRLYVIRTPTFKVEWLQVDDETKRAPRVLVEGSGAAALARNKRSWLRPLLGLVKQVDKERIRPETFAHRLSEINMLAHKKTINGTVGPNCHVAWIHRDGSHEKVKWARASSIRFAETTKARGRGLPNISSGADNRALLEMMVPHMDAYMKEKRRGGDPVIDEDAIRKDYDSLPKRPDPKLR